MIAEPCPPRTVIGYEAQPTRMFGAYTVYAHYSDGSSELLTHGPYESCIELAARLNRELGRSAPPAGAAERGR